MKDEDVRIFVEKAVEKFKAHGNVLEAGSYYNHHDKCGCLLGAVTVSNRCPELSLDMCYEVASSPVAVAELTGLTVDQAVNLEAGFEGWNSAAYANELGDLVDEDSLAYNLGAEIARREGVDG